MGRKIMASTVSEWYSHFTENPHKYLTEYQKDWTTIRNNVEGTNSTVAINTIKAYHDKFRLNQSQTPEPQSDSNTITITITIKIG